MPSEDRTDPKANEWMLRDATSSGPTLRTSQGSGPRTEKEPVVAKQSGVVQALALRTGKDPNELAAAIPEDTLRRLKFPVLTATSPDGSLSFKEPIQVIEGGKRSLLGADRGEAGRIEASKPRDERTGRFTK